MDATLQKFLVCFSFICLVELGIHFTWCLILFVAKTPALAREEQQVGRSSEAISGKCHDTFAGFSASFLAVWCCKDDTGQNGPYLWSSISTDFACKRWSSLPTSNIPSPRVICNLEGEWSFSWSSWDLCGNGWRPSMKLCCPLFS